MARPARLLALLGCAGLTALGAAGCDDTFVDPLLRDGAQAYSLQALIVADVQPRTQGVRVQRIRALPDPPSTTLDPRLVREGSVRSTPPARWSRRIVYYRNRTAGTVFEAAFRVEPGRRVSVVYEDRTGRTVGGAAHTPPTPSATVEAPTETTEAGERRVRQRVRWDARRLGDEVVVDYEGRDPVGRVRAVRVVYGPEAVADGETTVEIDLLRDLRALRDAGVVATEAGTLSGLQIQMEVLGMGPLPESSGRAVVQGATLGRTRWSPTVVIDP